MPFIHYLEPFIQFSILNRDTLCKFDHRFGGNDIMNKKNYI